MPSSSSLLFWAACALPAAGILKAVLTKHKKRHALGNIRGPPSTSWITGNLLEFVDPESLPYHRRIFDLYGQVIKLNGLFGDVKLYIADPQALSTILVKDIDIWPEIDLSGSMDMEEYLFGPGLLSTHGVHHRKQRRLLRSMFSSGYIRHSAPLVREITQELKSMWLQHIAAGEFEHDVADCSARLSLEIISRQGLGQSFDALHGDGGTYYRSLKEVTPSLNKIAPILAMLGQFGIAKHLFTIGRRLPYKDLHDLMDTVETMQATPRHLFQQRMDMVRQGLVAGSGPPGEDDDYITLLIKENANASAKDKVPDEELIAMLGELVFASVDTSSTAMCRTLSVLADHPDAQERLRAELEHADELDCDALMALPYLDAVYRETLRLHAPAPFATRCPKEDTVLPLHHPLRGADGRTISEIVVPQGTDVFVNIAGMHTDPALWGEDAYEWKPERWLSPLPDNVTRASLPGVHANSLAFLAGGKSCLGIKVAELNIKTFLATLIPAFRFAPSKREIVWRFGMLVTPNLKGHPTRLPCLPLHLTPI